MSLSLRLFLGRPSSFWFNARYKVVYLGIPLFSANKKICKNKNKSRPPAPVIFQKVDAKLIIIFARPYKGLFIIWVLHDTRKIRLFDQIKDSQEKPNQLDKWVNIFERRPVNTEQMAGMDRAWI